MFEIYKNPALNRIQTGKQLPRTPPTGRTPLSTIKASESTKIVEKPKISVDLEPSNPFQSQKALARTPPTVATSVKRTPLPSKPSILQGLEQTLKTPVAPYSNIPDSCSKVQLQENFIRSQVQKILKTPKSNSGYQASSRKRLSLMGAPKIMGSPTVIEEDEADVTVHGTSNDLDAIQNDRAYLETVNLASEIRDLKAEEVAVDRAVKTSGLQKEQLEYQAEQIKKDIEAAVSLGTTK